MTAAGNGASREGRRHSLVELRRGVKADRKELSTTVPMWMDGGFCYFEKLSVDLINTVATSKHARTAVSTHMCRLPVFADG